MGRFANLPNARCWRCHRPVDSKASILCPSCHAKETIKVHAHDTPSTEELGLVGQQGDYPYWIIEGMRGKQRRVIHKSEPMGG